MHVLSFSKLESQQHLKSSNTFSFIYNSEFLSMLQEFNRTSTWVSGLGVGRSPPPGRRPATALAGANRDKALVSSGITPAEKHPHVS